MGYRAIAKPRIGYLPSVTAPVERTEEDYRSSSVKELVEIRANELDLKTETQPRMVEVIAIMNTIQEGLSMRRNRSLNDIYIEQIDRRNISRSRKLRGEILQVNRGGESDGEELLKF